MDDGIQNENNEKWMILQYLSPHIKYSSLDKFGVSFDRDIYNHSFVECKENDGVITKQKTAKRGPKDSA